MTIDTTIDEAVKQAIIKNIRSLSPQQTELPPTSQPPSTEPQPKVSSPARTQQKKRMLQEKHDMLHKKRISEIEGEEMKIKRQITDLKLEKDVMANILQQIKSSRQKV
ncbi:hypothetical protein POJ06DRAFT_242835 [Lipomyces tetrasporus]|uniref:Uncharacterized protein n=1 Tax=Lipomyces tetrasporus TaxID=54092 RepID=A0AAD7VV20_9ASCO|nr:uncharacterized protein POJ06DRAFT_242835 [Lipomyces tetrasporus]KAJ8103807.1 hypothetical protein POJ06DRAFT_242835 [Lipomyces tetrasporus]